MRDDQGLLRAIGTRRLTASIINATIGAGIFVLPAVVAAGLGPAAPLAYLFCAALMLLIVLCLAAAGSRVSVTGGLYAYVEVAFGPFVGFLAAVLYSLSATFAAGSVASAFAGSMAVALPFLGTSIGRVALLLALFVLLASINVRGVTPGGRLVEATTIAKLTPLVVLVATGMWFIEWKDLAISALPSPSSVGRTAITLIFAFVGVEVALMPSGEVRDPARTVPRALFLALAVTTTIYLLVQAVAQGLLGATMTAYAAAPLAEAAARVLGPGGRLFVIAGAAVSMFGYSAGDMLGSPRAFYALARDGTLPAALARIHPRFHTPYVAIVLYAAIVATIAMGTTFTRLLVLANVSTLSLHLLSVTAAYTLQRRGVRTTGTPFETPGGASVPIAAGVGILWLLSQATTREFLLEALVLSAASALYLLRRSRSDRL